jgi:adenylosuccinate lyase
LGLASALFEFFSRKLPISRLQRDLTGSTVLRNLGVAFGHMLLACRRTSKGLAKVSPNREHMHAHVVAHPEVLAEAYQTILRRENVKEPYELLKKLTRGKQQVTLNDLHEFIDGLPISEHIKDELRMLTPESYIGIADKLTMKFIVK